MSLAWLVRLIFAFQSNIDWLSSSSSFNIGFGDHLRQNTTAIDVTDTLCRSFFLILLTIRSLIIDFNNPSVKNCSLISFFPLLNLVASFNCKPNCWLVFSFNERDHINWMQFICCFGNQLNWKQLIIGTVSQPVSGEFLITAPHSICPWNSALSQ